MELANATAAPFGATGSKSPSGSMGRSMIARQSIGLNVGVFNTSWTPAGLPRYTSSVAGWLAAASCASRLAMACSSMPGVNCAWMVRPNLLFIPSTSRANPALPPKLDGDQAPLSTVSLRAASMMGWSAALTAGAAVGFGATAAATVGATAATTVGATAAAVGAAGGGALGAQATPRTEASMTAKLK